MGLLIFFLTLGVSIYATLFRLRKVLGKHKYVASYNGSYPSVSIIRPVKGLDIGAEENFRAALNTGYPGKVETIFVFDGNDDPAYNVAVKVANESHHYGNGKDTVMVVIAGNPAPGRTGKLHAMIVGEKMATGELIAFSDSDTRPDQNVLKILVETLLSTPGAGSSFIPVVIDRPIKKAGDVFYALLQNALYAPWALLALGQKRELPFIMGQYMVFTRECLKAIGGVKCAAGQLVDDMYIGKCVAEAGFLNVVCPYSLSIVSSGLSIKQFIPIYRKWFQFSKNGLPFSFTWRQWVFCTQFYLLVALLPVALYNAQWLAASVAVVAISIFTWGLTMLHKEYGGSPVPYKFMWAPFTMLMMAPAIMISNKINHTVNWRGRSYTLNKHAALENNDA